MSDQPQHTSPRAKGRFIQALSRTVDTMHYFIRLLFRHAPAATALFVVGNVVSGLATPLVVWSLDGVITEVSGELSEPWVQVTPWLAALAVALILRSVHAAFTDYVTSVIRQRVDGVLYRDVFEKAIRIPLAAFESRPYYDKLENGSRAMAGRLVHVLSALAALISAGAGVVGLLFLFSRAHWGITAVLVGSVVLASAVEGKLARFFNRVTYGSSPQRQEITYWSDLLANNRAAAEVRVFQLSNTLLSRWRSAFDRYLININRARYRLALGGFFNGLVQEIIRWAATVSILVLTMGGAIGVGSMVALLYGAGRFRDLAGDFAWTVAELVEHGSTLGHLRDFLQLPDESPAAGHRDPPQPIREGVTFSNVSFTYPGAKQPALHQLNFTLAPGERVAVVGENGAGKTTLVRLLLGLYEPGDGRITVDGTELSQVDVASWRQQLSAVFQDFMRYPATVRENIGFGNVELIAGDYRHSTHADIVAAARKSSVHQMIQALPLGYDTLLGKQFDGGTELSTGQWQRLALARAYVRNPQIIVLDEPTAALDPKGEVEVYRQFQKAAEGLCAVFISHRLGSARLADRILVLKEGYLVESGSHADLMAANGEYARMYGLQAGWYADESEVSTG